MESEFLDVPNGKIAAVVTPLEMGARPAPRSVPDVAAELVEHAKPDLDWYRDLFTRVGGLQCGFGADQAGFGRKAIFAQLAGGVDVDLGLGNPCICFGDCGLGFWHAALGLY